MLTVIGIIVGILIIGTILFVNLSPQFGGKATEEQKKEYAKSKNYKDEKFVNTNEVKLDMSFGDMIKSLIGFLRKQPNSVPTKSLDVVKMDSLQLVNTKEPSTLYWFGHSSFLLQVQDKIILIDPMFGDVPAPHPLLGNKRFSTELPMEVEKIPEIDMVILSHDHYDHLDYGSIQKLKNKVKMFYAPLGVGVHLNEWGVEKERIVELDWWQETAYEDVKLVCTPAQHFSGRGFSDRAKTLWSSWVIQSNGENIFFSGDSGYSEHFKQIGDKYGPFDFAMIECGQYNRLWPDIHMFPEETAQAGLDVGAERIMPIHWGAFKLALHTWTDPIKRVAKKSNELGIELVAPKIGEPIFFQQDMALNPWWEAYEEK
ncbi:MBL fold metallo-hydrolase [Flagellimonas meridianipacifica]|uniref:L-ascorbate metabolism protein UlaG (Beta-lactamase superfamily) n=1 Tax=Flagellimonas meridianipacifica TaxID=1080225 RepID=A0A2T0MBG6_9FLAO|nr:MBL fold metallo-hydrolase [Allomuricauda pacifica]PRX54839.1 L-ascorbate metabolism protein UlaG (beta-lactamase superfamily) [Allomuricauda pacifica]